MKEKYINYSYFALTKTEKYKKRKYKQIPKNAIFIEWGNSNLDFFITNRKEKQIVTHKKTEPRAGMRKRKYEKRIKSK
jgi:hypothetical protein